MSGDVTRVLPLGNEHDLDCQVVEKLIRAAIRRTLDDLASIAAPHRLARTIHDSDGGATVEEVAVPSYRDPVVWERINNIWRCPETLALTDYIWDQGALKKTISGLDPSRDDWARFVYGDLVHNPLLVALEESLREDLVDGGVIKAWRVAPEKLEQCIGDVVSLYCQHNQLVIAYCPISGLALSAEGSFSVAPDIRLSRWSSRSVRIFMSRWAQEFLWDDFKAPYIHETIAEIQFSIGFGKGVTSENVVRQVQDRMDLLKWSLFIALGRDKPVAEGSCVLRGRLDVRMGRFRRDENLGPANTVIDQGIVDRCADLIRQFKDSAAHAQNLNGALWFFGRACVATLPRDILLESVMGMDLLVGLPRGDSRYRFCLHGAAVLAANPTEGVELFDTLQRVYDARSAGAHGHAAREVERLGRNARTLLSRMIDRIAFLIYEGKIASGDQIATSVARWVLNRATASA
jgi:hypothetical protein